MDLNRRRVCSGLVFPSRQLDRGFASVCRQRAKRGRSRFVQAFVVLFYHPMGIKDWRNTANGFAHELDPGERQFAIRLRVVERSDLVFENVKQAVDIHLGLELDGTAFNFGSVWPPVFSVLSLAPPTIENA